MGGEVSGHDMLCLKSSILDVPNCQRVFCLVYCLLQLIDLKCQKMHVVCAFIFNDVTPSNRRATYH